MQDASGNGASPNPDIVIDVGSRAYADKLL